MGMIASQITSLTIVYSIVYSDADQGKHQSSVSLAFVWGINFHPQTKLTDQLVWVQLILLIQFHLPLTFSM